MSLYFLGCVISDTRNSTPSRDLLSNNATTSRGLVDPPNNQGEQNIDTTKRRTGNTAISKDKVTTLENSAKATTPDATVITDESMIACR